MAPTRPAGSFARSGGGWGRPDQAADRPAVDLARWRIESVFPQVAAVFHLQRLIGGHPAAAVFQASLCLVRFNALQLVRGSIMDFPTIC